MIKLNIGNPGAFGFRAPEHLQRAITDHIHDTDPYTHQQGLPAAREVIAAFHKTRGTPNAVPERVFIGNGVSELIDLSLRALLNPGDEVLLPSPDYPLWSAATILNDGRPVYYRCHAGNGFLPDADELEALVSSARERSSDQPQHPPARPIRASCSNDRPIAANTAAAACAEIYEGVLYAKQVERSRDAGDVPCLSSAAVECTAPAAGASAGRCSPAIRCAAANSITPWICSARYGCAPTCRGSSRSRLRCAAPIPSRRCARRAGACTRRGAL